MPLDLFDYIVFAIVPLYLMVEWLDYKREQQSKK